MGDAATGGLAAGAALEGLPAADEIGARASGENFSVASLLLGRETGPTCSRSTATPGSSTRSATPPPVTGSPCSTRSRPTSARVFDGPGPPLNPVLRLLQPTVARARSSRAGRSSG